MKSNREKKVDNIKILSGHQPNYFPYPGLIGKIMMSDKFIYVTKVQFERKSWQNRNKIKTDNNCSWITVPTLIKGKFEQKICEVEINNDLNWKKKHFNSIWLNYKKAPFFSTYIDFFEDLYKRDWNYLCELDVYIMNFILKELECSTEILYDDNYDFQGKKTEFLVDMCKKTFCETYLSNKGSEDYVEISTFNKYNLNHLFINYIGKQYPQQFQGFEPNLSIIDMLFNCGKQGTIDILTDRNNYQIGELNLKIK